MEAPLNPIGPFVVEADFGRARRDELIAVIKDAPMILRKAVDGLDDARLDTRYRNWTIRQIVHHLADSHVKSYVRFKWALTEDVPTIKAYDEARWVALEDSRVGDIEPALALVTGLHQRWTQLLAAMTDEQFGRAFKHPESGKTIRLDDALCYYAWHCRHHTGQILWLRQQQGW
jgi:uncharacterized damage-inducible protein DinB